MLRKVYSLVSGACCPDNPDSPQHQEVLLPGTLYGMIVKERLYEILNSIRSTINADVRSKAHVDFNDSKPDFYCQSFECSSHFLSREISYESPVQNLLRHWCQAFELPRDR